MQSAGAGVVEFVVSVVRSIVFPPVVCSSSLLNNYCGAYVVKVSCNNITHVSDSSLVR